MLSRACSLHYSKESNYNLALAICLIEFCQYPIRLESTLRASWGSWTWSSTATPATTSTRSWPFIQPSYSVMWSRYLDGLLKFATKLLIFALVESMFCPYPMYSGTIGSTLRVVDYSLANSFDTDRLLHCSTKWKWNIWGLIFSQGYFCFALKTTRCLISPGHRWWGDHVRAKCVQRGRLEHRPSRGHHWPGPEHLHQRPGNDSGTFTSKSRHLLEVSSLLIL